MKSAANTVEKYLASLPPERKKVIAKVRQVILDNLPEGYEEAMNWGMITYQVPLATYPETYNKQPLMYAALASQKNHMAVYLTGIYMSDESRREFEIAEETRGGGPGRPAPAIQRRFAVPRYRTHAREWTAHRTRKKLDRPATAYHVRFRGNALYRPSGAGSSYVEPLVRRRAGPLRHISADPGEADHGVHRAFRLRQVHPAPLLQSAERPHRRSAYRG